MKERSLIARRIEEVRDQKGVSRQELADLIGETRLQIWRLENGVTDVPAETAGRIADALGVSVASLFRESKAS